MTEGRGDLREETPWGELVLRIRPGPPPSAALILEGLFLMDSESGVSEAALAARGLGSLRQACPTGNNWRVLLGGLGLGLTLRRLLEEDRVGAVQVVELFASLIDWNREALGFLNGEGLNDPRVTCHAGDLLAYLEQPPHDPFDLILLDIDNGPTMLSLPSNAALYSSEGLEALRRRLAPRGIVVFWATERSMEFETELSGLSWAAWSREEIRWRSPRGDRELSDELYFLTRRISGTGP